MECEQEKPDKVVRIAFSYGELVAVQSPADNLLLRLDVAREVVARVRLAVPPDIVLPLIQPPEDLVVDRDHRSIADYFVKNQQVLVLEPLYAAVFVFELLHAPSIATLRQLELRDITAWVATFIEPATKHFPFEDVVADLVVALL
jgi:hypothetical protein